MDRSERRNVLRPMGALAIALPILPALAPRAARAADADSASEAQRRANLAAHERFKSGWNRRDTTVIAALLGEDGRFSTPYSGGTVSGGAAVAQLLDASTFAAFPDFAVQTISADFVDPRTMYERWVITGSWSGSFKAGPLAGARPSGQRFTVPGVSRYEWDAGRLRRYDAWFDQLALLAQIGALGAPPKAGG